jgi:hypothetical protein
MQINSTAEDQDVTAQSAASLEKLNPIGLLGAVQGADLRGLAEGAITHANGANSS